MQRGLSIEAAEDEAFASFGTPDDRGQLCGKAWYVATALEVLRGLGGIGRHEPVRWRTFKCTMRAKPFAYHSAQAMPPWARGQPGGAFDLDPRDHLAGSSNLRSRTLGPMASSSRRPMLDDGVESGAGHEVFGVVFRPCAHDSTVHASARTILMDASRDVRDRSTTATSSARGYDSSHALNRLLRAGRLIGGVITAAQPVSDPAAREALEAATAADHQDMMAQLGIRKLRPGPSGNEGAPNQANYDEALGQSVSRSS